MRAVWTQDGVLVGVADDEPREIVVRRRIHAGHFGRLAAEQRTPVLPAARGHAGDDRLDDHRIEHAKRDVIQEEQRTRALHEDVVHAVVHEVMTHGVVPPRLDRDFEFRPDAVGAGDEHRLRHVRGNAKHSTKAAEFTARPRRERRLHVRLDAPLRVVGGIDVHTRRAIIERAALARRGHARRSCSNVTSRWKSATRRAMSSGPISSNRSTENFSTANDPIAEPYTTARRRFASERSPVFARYPMKPPANESPAPVGSKTDSSG